MPRWMSGLSIACAALALCAPVLAQEGGARVASGVEDGVYHGFAVALCRKLKRGGTRTEALSTAGSRDNLERLHAKEADFALAQQDVTASFLRRNPGSSVRVVDRVFFEYLHIFIRPSLRIDSAEDFRGMTLWAGTSGSGTRHTTLALLDAIGVSWSQCQRADESIPFERLSGLFGDREVDIATLVTVAGAPAVRTGLSSRSYVLFPLSYDALRILTEERPDTLERSQTFIASIQPLTYEFQDEEVPSLAVPVLLLARSGVAPDLMARTSRAAHEVWPAFRRSQGLAAAPRGARPLGASGLPLADGVARRATAQDELPWAECLIGLGVLALAAYIVLRWRRRISVSIRGHSVLSSVTAFLLLIGVATVGAHLSERAINPHFSSVHETFWSIVIYLVSGLTDRTPYTTSGRVFAMMVVVAGPLILAVVTGWVASTLVIHFLEGKMPGNLEEHILILNWNPRALHVVRQVHDPLLTAKDGVAVVVVLTDDERVNLKTVLKQYGGERDQAFEDVFFSPGDPTDEAALLNANAQDARSILVLADDRAGDAADERSIRSVFMLRRIARGTGTTGLRVVVELVDMSNAPVLEELAEDFPGVLEYVARGRIQIMLLTQALLNPGFTELYRDLLSVSVEDNELYTIAIPDSAAGRRFPEYASEVMAYRPHRPLVPVAVKRSTNGRPVLSCNPKPKDPLYELRRGDELVVISYDPPRAEDLP